MVPYENLISRSMAIKSEHHALHVSHVCADFATATRVGYTLPYTLRCAALHVP